MISKGIKRCSKLDRIRNENIREELQISNLNTNEKIMNNSAKNAMGLWSDQEGSTRRPSKAEQAACRLFHYAKMAMIMIMMYFLTNQGKSKTKLGMYVCVNTQKCVFFSYEKGQNGGGETGREWEKLRARAPLVSKYPSSPPMIHNRFHKRLMYERMSLLLCLDYKLKQISTLQKKPWCHY